MNNIDTSNLLNTQISETKTIVTEAELRLKRLEAVATTLVTANEKLRLAKEEQKEAEQNALALIQVNQPPKELVEAAVTALQEPVVSFSQVVKEAQERQDRAAAALVIPVVVDPLAPAAPAARRRPRGHYNAVRSVTRQEKKRKAELCAMAAMGCIFDHNNLNTRLVVDLGGPQIYLKQTVKRIHLGYAWVSLFFHLMAEAPEDVRLIERRGTARSYFLTPVAQEAGRDARKIAMLARVQAELLADIELPVNINDGAPVKFLRGWALKQIERLSAKVLSRARRTMLTTARLVVVPRAEFEAAAAAILP